MGFLKAKHLTAQGSCLNKIGIGLRVVTYPVVNRVVCRERIFRGRVIVKPGQAEILSNLLRGIADA